MSEGARAVRATTREIEERNSILGKTFLILDAFGAGHEELSLSETS